MDPPATPTTRAQRDLETRIASIYRDLADLDASGQVHRVHRGPDALALQRDRHVRYAAAGAGRLPAGFASLDASRPWICYWVLHSLALLGAPLPEGLTAEDFVAFLGACRADGGGYGGGPGQLAHLAPTYAAVAALLTLGGEAALASIDRRGIAGFLRRMAVPPERGGGFTMHAGGEADARACYTAVAVATALRLDAHALAAEAGAVDYLKRCQTYEGGLGGCPGNEAHGGYTYCGAAALALLGKLPELDLPRLARWVAQRQGNVEGGFNGRTNKLVDGCYSFWQGAVPPLLQRERGRLVEQALRAGEALEGDGGLTVPELPPLDGVCSPYEEACKESERLNDRAEAMVERAVAAEAIVLQRQEEKQQQQQQKQAGQQHEGIHGGTAGAAGASSSSAGGGADGDADGGAAEREARRLLKEAEAAQRASEEADLIMEIAQYSAAQLFICFDGEGSRPGRAHDGGDDDGDDGPEARAPGSEAAPGGPEAAAPPLFDADALQVWVLKGCQQQLKGGLRDKPGKSPDYYHTCYCLSGLSAAQHAPGGAGALGGAPNELARADTLLNVLEARVAEAAAFFDAQPAV
ncbi:farnesyltransferase subunit beta [Raphidocelis subcapitata]|uniref:Farnesyltransferase subunit beta n=1 Tax=Raphidocelis subcapitata TaxID=307507 RepID=A0A2V0NYD4_9CHLO|nr:farnesyltransferase subunit beta [Raphidocelis subcapitata]|eukprot:GBF91692.1 farnesyltransferase subunit beta [Raphidocelis subcapitata]